ncbi:MAG: DUF6273 domain-containing protein [Oscillospiraceae bacterium]|nr:DUF6273 domain-containing protein [Oscillospiraceae bacterium]
MDSKNSTDMLYSEISTLIERRRRVSSGDAPEVFIDDNLIVRVRFCGHDWRALDVQGGKALLLSEKTLGEKPYHSEFKEITWETCDLRKYLNGEFYDKLDPAKSMIAETRIENDDNPWYGTDGGNATIDKIFLLSIEEAVQYFGDSGQLRTHPKDSDGGDPTWIDDQYNDARSATDEAGRLSPWWLRSLGGLHGDCATAARVSGDGLLDIYGHFVNYDWVGVRPALWLNL